MNANWTWTRECALVTRSPGAGSVGSLCSLKSSLGTNGSLLFATSHRFAHRDMYRARGRVVKSHLRMTFEEALTHAVNDLRDNWESYKEKFLGE